MELGALAREIPAGGAAELFRKAKGYGFSQMQFNYATVLDEETPAAIPDALASEISGEAARNGIEIVAVNGTFNMAHPDKAVRDDGIARFEKVASSCAALGCGLVSLCTGSRNAEWMWAPHPDNDTAEAWKDMRASMEALVLIAEKRDLFLGIEPEASNVANTPQKAKRIIEELQSPRLKIILDAANLFRQGMAKKEKVRRIMGEAFELLGPRIAIAHGKDIKEGDGIDFTCAGKGIVDFGFFREQLEKAGYKGGMILHGFKREEDIPASVEYMRKAGY